jgi:hypothetical protein
MRVSVFNCFKPQTSDQVVSLERHPSKSSAFTKTVKKLFSGLNIAGYKSTTTTKLPHTRQFEQSLENMNRLWANQSARPAASAQTDETTAPEEISIDASATTDEITETEEGSLETLQKMLKSQVDINDPSSVRQAEWKLKKQKAAPSLEGIPEEPEVNESYIIHNTLINELGELEKQKPISDHSTPEEEKTTVKAFTASLSLLGVLDFTKLSDANVQAAIRTSIERICDDLPYIRQPAARESLLAQLKLLARKPDLSTDTKALIRGIIDQQKRLQKEIERQLNHLQATGMISPFEINGKKTNIAVFKEKPMVLVNVSDSLKLPFYISTGQGKKKDVPPGHWYPFFGLGTRFGAPYWFIKASTDKEINDFYEIGKLKEIASQLDTALGDIRPQCAQEWIIPNDQRYRFKDVLNDSIQNGVTRDTAIVSIEFKDTPCSKDPQVQAFSSLVNKVLINGGLVLQELQRTTLHENSSEEEQATALQALHTSLGRLESLDSVELQRPEAQGIITHIRNQLVLIRPPEARSELNQRLKELVDTSQTENDSIQNEVKDFLDILTNLKQKATEDLNENALLFHTPIQHIGEQLPYISQPADRQLLLGELTELADKQGIPVETKTLIDQITQQAGRLPLATFLGMAVPKKKSH